MEMLLTILKKTQKALKNRKRLKKLQEENASLKKDLEDAEKELRELKQSNSGELEALRNEKEKLDGQNKTLTETNQKLTAEKQKLEGEKNSLTKEREDLNNQLIASQKQVNELKNSQQVLNNEKIELSREKDELERKYAPYDKLEKLYEVFLEVKECLIFEFVKDAHSAMDLIGYVLSDSKYYVEEFYKKTQQELRNKNSDKGEKLVALFDLLFECIKDKKFKRLETPSSYNSACITLYPEQSSTGNIQRVVLRGYSYNDKIMPSIVDMGG